MGKWRWGQALVVLGCLAAMASGSTVYEITDIGTMGGPWSHAAGINDLGQVVGTAMPPGNYMSGFVWDDGAVTIISRFPDTVALAAINNSGQVVGTYTMFMGGRKRAFLWEDGVMTTLPGLGGSDSFASDINDNGQIAGSAMLGAGAGLRAVRWDDGIPMSLDTLPGGFSSMGSGINSLGQVVGYSTPAPCTGFVWDGTMTNLGGNTAYDINDSGLIVGITHYGPVHAVKWEGGGMSGIGTLGYSNSYACAVNNAGQIVGYAYTMGGPGTAFIYQNGIMVDLNTLLPVGSGWVLGAASDINNRGQIVGSGTINGQTHAFLLTPVPSPGAMLLGMVGVGVVGAFRRMRSVA